jgi:hypothetical protein
VNGDDEAGAGEPTGAFETGAAGAGVAGAALAGAAAGATGAGAAAAGAAGVGAAEAVAGAAGAGAGAAAGADAAAGAGAAAAGLGKVSRTLRSTGDSMVEDGDLTYSPSALKCAIRDLLSVPSSLASALTRTFATFLLSWVCAATGAQTVLVLGLAHC